MSALYPIKALERPLMKFDWTTILAAVVIVVAIGFLIYKRKQRQQ